MLVVYWVRADSGSDRVEHQVFLVMLIIVLGPAIAWLRYRDIRDQGDSEQARIRFVLIIAFFWGGSLLVAWIMSLGRSH